VRTDIRLSVLNPHKPEKEPEMSYLIVRHTVEDYPKFKAVFDEHAAARREFGSLGGMIFRGATDANEIVVVLEWKDLESAKAFSQSPGLREAMARAGVTGAPTIYFLEKVSDLKV
jgi:heme-degrading monooxygenase HmoA